MTNVEINFILFGSAMEHDSLSKMLEIEPTRQGVNTRVEPEVAFWELTVGPINTFYAEEVVNKFLTIFENKEAVLVGLKKEFSLESRMNIIPKAENDILPSIYLNKKIVEFLYLTDSDLDIDLYVNW